MNANDGLAPSAAAAVPTFTALTSDPTGVDTFERYLWQTKLAVLTWLSTLGVTGPVAIVAEHVGERRRTGEATGVRDGDGVFDQVTRCRGGGVRDLGDREAGGGKGAVALAWMLLALAPVDEPSITRA